MRAPREIVPASEVTAGSIGTKALGSGPFKLDSWDPNSKEVLSANADWAGFSPAQAVDIGYDSNARNYGELR